MKDVTMKPGFYRNFKKLKRRVAYRPYEKMALTTFKSWLYIITSTILQLLSHYLPYGLSLLIRYG